MFIEEGYSILSPVTFVNMSRFSYLDFLLSYVENEKVCQLSLQQFLSLVVHVGVTVATCSIAEKLITFVSGYTMYERIATFKDVMTKERFFY